MNKMKNATAKSPALALNTSPKVCIGSEYLASLNNLNNLSNLMILIKRTSVTMNGKKNGKNRKDLLKAIHYVVLLMSSEDNNKEDTNDN